MLLPHCLPRKTKILSPKRIERCNCFRTFLCAKIDGFPAQFVPLARSGMRSAAAAATRTVNNVNPPKLAAAFSVRNCGPSAASKFAPQLSSPLTFAPTNASSKGLTTRRAANSAANSQGCTLPRIHCLQLARVRFALVVRLGCRLPAVELWPRAEVAQLTACAAKFSRNEEHVHGLCAGGRE